MAVQHTRTELRKCKTLIQEWTGRSAYTLPLVAEVSSVGVGRQRWSPIEVRHIKCKFAK